MIRPFFNPSAARNTRNRHLFRRWKALLNMVRKASQPFCVLLICAGIYYIANVYSDVKAKAKAKEADFRDFHEVKPYSELIDAQLSLPELRTGTENAPEKVGSLNF